MRLEEVDGCKEPPEGLVTFEEYLGWCEDTTRAEWLRRDHPGPDLPETRRILSLA